MENYTCIGYDRCDNTNSLFFLFYSLEQDLNAELLITSEVDVNSVDADKKSALYWAIATGQSNLTDLLIDNGADVNLSDSSQTSPLILSVRTNQSEIVVSLVESEANINHINKYKRSGMFNFSVILFLLDGVISFDFYFSA